MLPPESFAGSRGQRYARLPQKSSCSERVYQKICDIFPDVCSQTIKDNRKSRCPQNISMKVIVGLCAIVIFGLMVYESLGAITNTTRHPPINMDPEALIDGGMGQPIPVSNWGATYNPLRVWCFVNALYDEEILMAIQESWGRYCDKLLFFVDEAPDQNILENEAKNSLLENIIPIRTHVTEKKSLWDNILRLLGRRLKKGDLWEKIWKSIVYVEQHYHGQYDYIMKADTDTWISVNNFKSWAKYFDPNLSWYMGHTEVQHSPDVFNAGGHYVLSRGALERVTKLFQSNEFKQREGGRGRCSAQTVGWEEDLTLAVCLRDIGIHPLNTLNKMHQLRFSPFPLEVTQDVKPKSKSGWFQFFFGERDHYGWYFRNRFEDYPHGKDCCDTNMIGFHDYKIKNSAKDNDGSTKGIEAEKLRQKYLELDVIFESDKMKDVPIPPRPTTFLFAETITYRNEDIMYRHE